MKTVKIFIASSADELQEDKLSIGNYFRQLNDIYVKRGFHFELIMSGERRDIDTEITDSELCFFLFFSRIGENVKHEFDVAVKAFNNSSKPRIITYFKEIAEGESISDEVKTFMSRLNGEFKHYYDSYGHVDTLKLGIIMQIKLLKLDVSEIRVEDGAVKLNGEDVARVENIPILNGNDSLRRLTARKKALSERKKTLESEYFNDKTDEKREALVLVNNEYDEICKLLESAEKGCVELLVEVSEYIGGYKDTNERIRRALEYCSRGDPVTAQQILDDERAIQKEKESNDKLWEVGDELKAKAKQGALELVEQLKLSVKLEKARGVSSDNAEKIYKKYESILELVEKYGLDKGVLYDYASFLHDQNDYAKAIHIAKLVEEYYKDSRNGVAEIDRAALMVLLANLYSNTNRFGEARDYLTKSIEILKKLREKYPDAYLDDLAACYNNLAALYDSSNCFDDAEEYHLKAIRIRKMLAETDWDRHEMGLAASYNNIAILYNRRKKHRLAEEYHLKAIEIFKKHREAEWNLATSYHNLASLYDDMKDYDASEKYFFMALEIREDLVQKNPDAFEPDLADSYSSLAMLLRNCKKYDASAEYCLKDIEIRERLAQKNPDAFEPDLANSYNIIANLYSCAKQYEKAETYYCKAMAIYEKIVEKEPQAFEHKLATVYNNLAILYRKTKEHGESEHYHLKAIEINQRLAQDDPDAFESELAQSYNNLANLYYEIKSLDDAEKYYLLAKEVHEKLYQNDRVSFGFELASTYNNLANLYENTGEYGKAEEYYLKAISIKEMLYERSSSFANELARSYYNICTLYYKLKCYEKAEAFCLMSIKLREDPYQRDPVVFASELYDCYWVLAAIYKHTRSRDEIKATYKKAADCCLHMSEEERRIIAYYIVDLYTSLGGMCYGNGELSEAEEAYSVAAKLYDGLFSADPDAYSADYCMVLKRLHDVFLRTGKPDKAEEALHKAEAVEEEKTELLILKKQKETAEEYVDRAEALLENGQKSEAEKAYLEAIHVYERLCKKRLSVYGARLAEILCALGMLHEETDFSSSEKAYLGALTVYDRLGDSCPKDKLEDKTTVLRNLAVLYYNYSSPEALHWLRIARDSYKTIKAVTHRIYTEDINELEELIKELETPPKEEPKKKGILAKLFGKK